MEKKRFMRDLQEISKERNDDILLAVAKNGNFHQAIEEISNRKEAKEIVEAVLRNKPEGKKILQGLEPHYGTKGLRSVLKQTGKIIGEEDFNQGVKALDIMRPYAGKIDICGLSKDIKEISYEVKDLSLLREVFEKYKNLEGKEIILQSLKNQKDDLFEKSYLEIIEGWKSDYVHSIVRELQTKKGLSPTLFAIKDTAKKIQKKEAMEDIALLSESFDYKERADKMNGLRKIILFKGDKNNFQKILKLGKYSDKKSIYQLGEISAWTDNQEIYNNLIDLASVNDLSYELDRLEKIAYWNNAKIFENSVDILKHYSGKPESKRIMKKIAAINNFSQNEFVSKYISKMAINYSNNKNRDKYLAEIQRYAVRGDIEYVKDKLIKYNKPLRPENLENKLKKFLSR